MVFIFTSGFRVPLKLPLVGERTASLIAGGLPRALRHGRTSHKTLPSGQDSPSPKRDTTAQKDGTSCSRTFTGCALTLVHLLFALKPDAYALTIQKKVLTPGISFADKHNKELKGCWEAFAAHVLGHRHWASFSCPQISVPSYPGRTLGALFLSPRFVPLIRKLKADLPVLLQEAHPHPAAVRVLEPCPIDGKTPKWAFSVSPAPSYS